MAQKVTVTLVDDLDGKTADETVTFSLDGHAYELDLSKKNADKFRALFQDYIAAGRKVGKKAGARGSRTVTTTGPTAKELRDWGRSNGFDVPARGRIPADVRDAFDKAAK